MKERDFQSTFNNWLKQVYKKTAAFELKITHTDSLPFNSVKDHQIAALEAAKWGVLVYKIPDVGYQNPFDCFSLVNVPAFVVIKYASFFCLIDVETFTLERDRSKRKSLTSARAKELAHTIV